MRLSVNIWHKQKRCTFIYRIYLNYSKWFKNLVCFTLDDFLNMKSQLFWFLSSKWENVRTYFWKSVLWFFNLWVLRNCFFSLCISIFKDITLKSFTDIYQTGIPIYVSSCFLEIKTTIIIYLKLVEKIFFHQVGATILLMRVKKTSLDNWSLHQTILRILRI